MIRSVGGAGVAVRMDVTDEASVAGSVERAGRSSEAFDLLVNNAGVSWAYSVVDRPVDEWRRVMDVNATGTFLVSREVARRWLADGRQGSIVSVASIAGKRGDPAARSLLGIEVRGRWLHAGARAGAGSGRDHGERDLSRAGRDDDDREPSAGWGTTVEAMLEEQAIVDRRHPRRSRPRWASSTEPSRHGPGAERRRRNGLRLTEQLEESTWLRSW